MNKSHIRRLAEKAMPALLLLAIAPLAAPVQAQDQQQVDMARYDRALAAGYKAAFICSGLWNGGKSIEQIEADELSGIYPRIADIVPQLEAKVDQVKREVHVAFADDSPPRIARWREGLGCAQLPIGASADKALYLPSFSTTNGLDLWDGRPWPMGDKGALARKPDAALQKLAEQATSGNGPWGGKTSAVLVLHKGKIIAESYMTGHDMHTSQRTWSVAKSLAATLIGHASQLGYIDVLRPAHIDSWHEAGDPRRGITTDMLLRMSSGMVSDTPGNRTDALYMGGASIAERSAQWPLLYPAGTRYRYANNDTLLAVQSMMSNLPAEKRLGFPLEFFRSIGMTRTIAETDWQGSFILSSQVWTSARDLARLGLLYLNDGLWHYPDGDGEAVRLLPENWRTYVSSPRGPQPDRAQGYGAGFWLLNNNANIPADSFAAMGNRGQYLVVIPSLDLVIVRRGYDSADNRLDIEDFTSDIIKMARFTQ